MTTNENQKGITMVCIVAKFYMNMLIIFINYLAIKTLNIE
jgi:hypothetical protein